MFYTQSAVCILYLVRVLYPVRGPQSAVRVSYWPDRKPSSVGRCFCYMYNYTEAVGAYKFFLIFSGITSLKTWHKFINEFVGTDFLLGIWQLSCQEVPNGKTIWWRRSRKHDGVFWRTLSSVLTLWVWCNHNCVNVLLIFVRLRIRFVLSFDVLFLGAALSTVVA